MTGAFAVFALPGPARARAFAVLAAAVAWLVLPGVASAQTPGGIAATARAEAAVLQPLTVVKNADLDFGRIAAKPTAGTVTINPATNTCSVTNGLLRIGPCQRAEFSARGSSNALVRVRVDQTTVNLTGPGPAMVLNNFTIANGPTLIALPFGFGIISASNPASATSRVFDFNVGGRLRVGANQPPGRYSGRFSVTVDFF